MNKRIISLIVLIVLFKGTFHSLLSGRCSEALLSSENFATSRFASVTSAMYNFETGSSSQALDSYGYLRFYEVQNGTVNLCNHLYVSADISAIKSSFVTKVTFDIYISGRSLMYVYKADGNFVPGETPYDDMPKITDVSDDSLITIVDHSNLRGYISIDVTEYVEELILAGKDKLNLMISQGSTSTFGIRTELGDSSTRPYISVIFNEMASELSKLSHPYIHASSQKLEQIKNSLETGDEYTKILYAKTKSDADGFLSSSVVSHGGTATQSYNKVDEKILSLMTVYYIENNEIYLDRALMEFENFKSITNWNSGAQLDNTQTASVLAICYDWLYNYLSVADRKWAEETIKEKSLDIAYKYYQNPEDYDNLRVEYGNMNIQCGNSTYNHSTYNNSNLLTAALAISPMYPEYSSFIISNIVQNVVPYLELVGEKGGHEEPIGYYGYTSEKIITMLSALDSSLGTMYGLNDYPGFKTTAYYPLYMYGAGPFAFGDTSPSKGSYDTNALYFAAKHSGDVDLMKVISQNFKKGNTIMPLLWYDCGELDNPESDSTLALDRLIFPSNKAQNIASFRNSWNTSSLIYTAMYTGCATSNGHADAVSGSFCLDAFGERFVTPMGLGNYSYSNYWDNSQNGGRWKWYEKRPEGNCCLVINPSESVGQDVYENAEFETFETADGGGYAIADLSKVYKEYVSSYKRGIKLFDNRSRVILQDEVKMLQNSDVYWSFNTPADIEILSDNTALLIQNGKSVYVRFTSNQDFTLAKSDASKLSTSPQAEQQKIYPAYSKLCIWSYNVADFELSAEFVPVLNDYTIPESYGDYQHLSQWSADDVYAPVPVLDDISVNGKTIAGFVPDVFSYSYEYNCLTDDRPSVEYKKSHDVSVSVIEDNTERCVLKVSANGRDSFYIINFDIAAGVFDNDLSYVLHENFTDAVYESFASASGGITECFPGSGWMYHLYASGVYRYYYCSVDIADLKDKNILSAKYSFVANGDLALSVHVTDCGFVPGKTPFGELPKSGTTVCEIIKRASTERFEIDLTEAVNKSLAEGKDTINLIIVQNKASTAVIAGKNGYSSQKPYLEIIAEEKKLLLSDVFLKDSDSCTSARLAVKNNSEKCENVTLVTASYDDNKLISLDFDSAELKEGVLVLDCTVEHSDGINTKIFVWDAFDSLFPHSNYISVG